MTYSSYSKKTLRIRFLTKRDSFSANQRAKLSKQITSNFTKTSRFTTANCIASYSPIGSEVDTSMLMAKILRLGKILLLPVVEKHTKQLTFYRVKDYRLDTIKSLWGILEPDPKKCQRISISAANVIIVPGVVFSQKCQRIGYGGGYYDYSLPRARNSAYKVGLGFDFQILPSTPTCRHDRKLSSIISEKRVFGSKF